MELCRTHGIDKLRRQYGQGPQGRRRYTSPVAKGSRRRSPCSRHASGEKIAEDTDGNLMVGNSSSGRSSTIWPSTARRERGKPHFACANEGESEDSFEVRKVARTGAPGPYLTRSDHNSCIASRQCTWPRCPQARQRLQRAAVQYHVCNGHGRIDKFYRFER